MQNNENDSYVYSLEETLRQILELPIHKGLPAAKELAADALGEDLNDVVEEDDMDEEVEELDFDDESILIDEKELALFGGY